MGLPRISGESTWRRSRTVVRPTVPGAGAEWLATVPAGHVWWLRTAWAQLATSAVAADRVARLALTDGVATYLDVPPAEGQAASQTRRYSWLPATSWSPPLVAPGSTVGAVLTDSGASQTGAATALAPAIAAVAGQTGFITGFEVTGGGATAAAALDVTLTGLLQGTAHYAVEVPAGAGLSINPVVVAFGRPLPASAVNTAITLNVPSFGAGNAIQSATIHGYTSLAAGATAGADSLSALPELVIPAGWTIGSATDGIDAGDQWSNIALHVIDITARWGDVDLDMLPDLYVQVVEPGLVG